MGSSNGYTPPPTLPQASAAEITNESAVAKYVSPARVPSSKRTAKSWVNFSIVGGVPSINDSLNVSSITDNSAGQWVVNYTSAHSSANFAALVSSSFYAVNGTPMPASAYSKTTTSLEIRVYYVGAYYDVTFVSAATFL